MKNIIKTAKCVVSILYVISILCLTELSLSSCSQGELEVQQNYPFEVSVMPVAKDIARDQTVEIRIKILPNGNYQNTQNYLRYFQFEGTGELKHFNDPPYLPNDSYSIPDKEFRLYYTSTSEVSQSFKIWISDQFGNENEIEFQFDNKD
ncbi:DUF3872 domain-containing protein [Chryseobacterium sp. Ch-15]|uniref:DUF3872 domain-containing protein n=1 Tax=Chryseobacterium muglaense TaxID=2893752 RepID=A0A9Q3YXJ4_9FLAO|nr:DUF3872 domain-containing protein [Chryseobacterium muglaense]MBD3905380.1 DUF3872 domain-containing protein [Chryseobacterium muglaense]MCC9036895.1 DUF3872 domain-containing protein [Chryseobacterium muglaense]MCM2555243.1 DUF3872 domain-containing protein [Chryseobacterium muglaense]